METCAFCGNRAWRLSVNEACRDCEPLVASVRQRLASGELCRPSDSLELERGQLVPLHRRAPAGATCDVCGRPFDDDDPPFAERCENGRELFAHEGACARILRGA